MTTSTITAVNLPKQVDTFVSLGKTIADSHKKHYGALVKFSALLVETFGADWHTVKASDATPNGIALREVKDKLFAQLKAADHTNPSKVWADLREYAVRQNAIAATSGQAPDQSEQDGGAPEVTAATEKTLEQKIASKLADIRKMIAKQDIKSPAVKKCEHSILRAMMALEPAKFPAQAEEVKAA